MKRVFGAGLILFPLTIHAQEQDVASLHMFNGVVQVSEKFRVVLHSRVRFNHNISDFFQVRGGPILMYDWKPRLQWQAGYYLLEQQSKDTLVTIQRPWVGAQIRVYGHGGFNLDWRNALERHMYSGPGDFTRFRSRMTATYQMKSGWQPFGGVEALAMQGHVVGRYAGGMSYATDGGNLYGLGYEFRGDIGKPGSHLITTLMQFNIAKVRKRAQTKLVEPSQPGDQK